MKAWLGACAAVLAFALAGQSTTSPTMPPLPSGAFERVRGPATGGAVLDVGAGGSWRDQAVTTPSVLVSGGRYIMWFTGVERGRAGESAYLYRTLVGAADSADGRSWTLLNGGKPVFTQGAYQAFDQHSVGHPTVLRDGNRFLMWYGGADGLDATRDIRIERIGLASSVDGINWTRRNEGKAVIDIGDAGSPDSIQATGPSVVRVRNGFMMWYGAYNGHHSLMAAHSSDGIHWVKAPVTGLGEGQALGPAVHHDASGFYMQYSTLIDGRWTLVAARSGDGLAWLRLNDGAPVLPPAPSGSFDAATAGQNASVHPSHPLIDGDRVRLWYAGEDPAAPHRQRIGLMEAPRHRLPATARSAAGPR